LRRIHYFAEKKRHSSERWKERSRSSGNCAHHSTLELDD